MDWFSFWLNGFNIAAQVCLQLSFVSHFTEKKQNVWHYFLYLLLLSTSSIAVSVFHFQGLGIGVQLFALYIINRLILHNSRPVSWVTTFLTVYVAQLSFGILNPIESLLFPHVLGHTLLYLLIVLAMLFSLALCFCCYRLISAYFSLRDNLLEPYLWMLLPPALFFFAVELYISQTAYGRILTTPYPMTETGKQLALLVLQLLGLGALFCTLYAYKRTCAGFRAKAALTSLEQETHAQKTYVAEAQMRYEQTRAFRHDIKNHLSVLDGLLKADKLNQAKRYLQKLQTVTGDLSFPFHTNHPVVDILLGDKLELAKSSGVKTDISLTLPNPCGVDDFDLCVIFANALDNAIYACMQSRNPKSIRISGERQGDFYMLEFENTCSLEPLQKLGTGLSNIKAVAEKYGGAMTIETSACLFRLNVLLNISRQSEGSSEQIS